MWRSRISSKNHIGNISSIVENNDLIKNLIHKEGINDRNTEPKTNELVIRTNNRIISKYGTVDDYRESKILSSRRLDLRGHTLTMVNVITDTNETRKHLDDRL